MKIKKALGLTAKILVGVGALNWGLIQLMNFNLVEKVNSYVAIGGIIYTLVGISGLLFLVDLFSKKKFL